MFSLDNSRLGNLIIHYVGNKLKDDPLLLSKSESGLDEATKRVLWDYVFAGFKSPEFYKFTHPTDLDLNGIYTIAQKAFANPEGFIDHSQDIATLLFEASQHPQIKSGELLVIFFNRLSFGNIEAPALGIFKSEKKMPFMFTENQNDIIDLFSYPGINPGKVDKACLIFNVDEEDGYQVLSVDNLNHGEETKFWFDDFLRIKARSTEYSKTSGIINIAKDFIQNDFNEADEMEKSEKITYLNKTKEYFAEKEAFNPDEFGLEVFEDKVVADRFRAYTAEKDFEGFNYDDPFEISPEAFKKNQKVFKSILKLDKNFHIYIHGNKEMIEKGVDENGRKYYKLFYEEES